ncbi:MAG: hypothetical protein MI919_27990 [Holophagales bacterium]|nr:hypothetical protein [Holophagales bacterium]
MSSSTYVSTFENLVKPIADPSASFVRKAISGYFCALSNITGFDSTFRFLVVIPSFTVPGAPGEAFFDRELTVSDAQGGPQNDPNSTQGNHNSIFDITGGTQFGQTAVGELTFLGSTQCIKVYWSDTYRLCNGATAQFALLPNLAPTGPGVLARELLEIRGWVALGIYPNEISSEAAALTVLLTPDQRGTFLPLDVDSGTDPVDLGEVSQLNTTLPTAFGGSETNLGGQSPAFPINVQNFANANGIPLAEIRPFSNVLQPVV